jgi:hypothetical protein
LLAEKIETRAEFVTARDQGFVHFRIFWHPETMSTHDMPTNRMNYLGMLPEVSTSGTGVERTGEAGEGRGVGVLPPAALSEFDNLRVESGTCGGGCGAGKNSDLVLSALVRGRFGE